MRKMVMSVELVILDAALRGVIRLAYYLAAVKRRVNKEVNNDGMPRARLAHFGGRRYVVMDDRPELIPVDD